MGIRGTAFRGSLILAWAMVVVSGCQRQETPEPVVAEPETQTEAGGPAWVDAKRIANADTEPHNWLAHGRTWSEQRYSPLSEINESNIGELGLAWYFDLDTARGQQATPIVVDGVMYTTSAWSKVQVLDAATGQLKWQYDPEVSKEWDIKSCCGVQNRGAAVWKGRVFIGTIDGRLIALNAETGELEWDVQTTNRNERYSITGAPRVFDDKVVIGKSRPGVSMLFPVTRRMDSKTKRWKWLQQPGAVNGGLTVAAARPGTHSPTMPNLICSI